MNNRFKFRTWDNAYKKYRNGLAIHDNQVCTYDDNTCVLEQCTGLRDKNGKLIYEGDLIKDDDRVYKVIFSYEDVASCGCCVPSFTGCGFVMEDNRGYRGDLKSSKQLKVIGNVHETPELLEGA